MNNIVNFEIAQLLKEKGYDNDTLSPNKSKYFYTTPNSEMYGIDEYGIYSMVNTPEKLYKLGEHCVVGIENVYQAPTISEVVMWLYDDKYGIWIWVQKEWDNGKLLGFEAVIDTNDGFTNTDTFNTPSEAYSEAILYTLKNLI